MKKRMIWATLCPLLLLLPLFSIAQSIQPAHKAVDYLKENSAQWGLNQADLKDMLISDSYLTKHNGVTHIYFQQSVDGTPIYNSITGVHLSAEGEPFTVGHRFLADVQGKVTSSTAKIAPKDALLAATKHLEIPNASIVEKSTKVESGNDVAVFEGANISHADISVKPIYVYQNDVLRLAWDLAIDDKRNPDYLSIRVDAEDGSILDTYNWTTYCKVDHVHKGCGSHAKAAAPAMYTMEEVEEAVASGSYRVFPLPAESPSHGSHDLISNPHIEEASPFGWHDVDGDGQNDYTITRGNNVWAYPDLNDDDQSTGGEPDGGSGLVFDFPFDENDDPIQSLEAATTNLFYMSNMMHDITYLFGFDEAAGNFQSNNFGNGGRGSDFVRSEAQDGSQLPAPTLNNANFATPPDGASGRMQMFLWTSGGEVFRVLEPGIIAKGYESGEADFGPSILTGGVDVEAEIVEAFDADPSNPSFCCGDVINGEDIDGKIALIDRGGCFFDQKVRNCEEAGAIAVIVCNFAPAPAGMAASGTVAAPTIPAIMLGSNDCQAIRAFAGRGAIGKIKAPDQNLFNLDGDFDNGIIAHEYGHGISNRLTAGPSQAGCLGNAEQMGEGWSDYFSLVTTVEPGDAGEDPRGIGTYAQRQGVDGGGIRPRTYTTDFDINELTYRFVANEGEISQPHGIGTVWCTMLWDLYWALTDEYGYDADLSNKDAGNNIAVQLVMDGMKLQPCAPGFVDGRDAILLADTLNNEAANACLIWEVFARRGLGYYADQGSSDDRFDGVENFETAPLCQNKLRIDKQAVNLISAGDTIDYTLNVSNNKADASENVIVTDIIPDGCSYLSGSASVNPSINGNEISFELGTMSSLQQETITYSVVSSSRGSATLWLDDFENGEDNWDLEQGSGFTIWYTQDEYFNSGENAFYTENQDDDADSRLFQFDPIEIDLDNPGVRFFHWYSTSAPTNGPDVGNVDGGFIEISTDGDAWSYIQPEEMLRNGYNGPLPYGTFVLPNLSGFSGNSGGFVDTYVDLSRFQGENVQIRFRMGTEEGGLANLPLPAGWVVDDVEYLDLLFYNTEVCATSDAGDRECALLPGKGTLVEPNVRVNIEDLPTDVSQALVFPNPTATLLRLKIEMEQASKADINVFNLEGRMVRSAETTLRAGQQIIDVNVADMPIGQYMIQVNTEAGSFTKKWIKQ